MTNRRILHRACAVRKIIEYEKPRYLFEKLKWVNDTRARVLRRCTKLATPQHKTAFFRGSFKHAAAKVWNDLPPPLREPMAFLKYKRLVQNHLLDMQGRFWTLSERLYIYLSHTHKNTPTHTHTHTYTYILGTLRDWFLILILFFSYFFLWFFMLFLMFFLFLCVYSRFFLSFRYFQFLLYTFYFLFFYLLSVVISDTYVEISTTVRIN
jgi:hypothetical protein